MKEVVVVITVFGEFIGLVDASDEDQNSLNLHKPLKVTMVQSARGPMTTLLPVAQLINIDLLRINSNHLVTYGTPPQEVADKYREITTGIALPKSSSQIITG